MNIIPQPERELLINLLRTSPREFINIPERNVLNLRLILIQDTRPSLGTPMFRWECGCGGRGHDAILYVSSKRAIEHVEKIHPLLEPNRPPAGVPRAHEESRDDSDAFPDDDVTNDVQHDVPVDLRVPSTPPDKCPASIVIDVRAETIDVSDRWRLFTDDELILLGENLNAELESETEDTRLGHFNPQMVALLEPMVLGINAELTRRELPLSSI